MVRLKEKEKSGADHVPMHNPPAEGSWDAVMKLIGQAHSMLHEKGIVRIQTDIRVGSRYVLREVIGYEFVD